ncbi:MAG: hypothetical protein WBJ13_04335 [Sedimentibacter sp.]
MFNSLENIKESTDNLRILVPMISKDDDCTKKPAIENIEFDLDVKIWISSR